MRAVEIPEPLYDEASRQAAARGESLETLVRDVLSAFLDDAPLVLTREQRAKIAKAEAEIDAGDFVTLDGLRSELIKNRAEWTRDNPR